MFASRSRSSNSIARLAGPLIGESPASQRRTVRPPPLPSRRASASPFVDKPSALRAERISGGDIFGDIAPFAVFPIADQEAVASVAASAGKLKSQFPAASGVAVRAG